MKRSRDGKRNIPTVRAKCGVMIPSIGSPVPTRCGDREFKAGKCAGHYRDARNASDARRIEAKERREKGEPIPSSPRAVRVKAYIPKAERKYTKNPIRVRPEPAVVA